MMAPVIQASGWQTVLTWVMAPLVVLLHVFFWEPHHVHRQVGGPFEHVPSWVTFQGEAYNNVREAAAMTSRVGVCVGVFRAHPPISTQTRDTRLLCVRSFQRRTGGELRLGIPGARLTGRGRG